MAKSIRSKHRRQMRNIKRQHYAKKDLERLKRLAIKSSELKDIVTMKSAQEIKEPAVDAVQQEDPTMEVEKLTKVYDKRTLQDENGHYPDWMNKRAVKKQRQKLKLIKIKQRVGKATKKLRW
ncbi:unnamed protein product [Candidula unifasciata]|uniref:Uncharacterized protein n=1 Tax=Candidula unifasciata TaxID=100452 RepID=A0A8S4ADR0_9EUPU|nr:unnamed protein product [Candidula unifasciata]